MFRFHTGSIRSLPVGLRCVNLPCFDSILVRLEVLREKMNDASEKCFDSILVRLEEVAVSNRSMALLQFRFHTGSIRR